MISVSGSVCEDLSAFKSVLGLNKGIGHPVVVESLAVSEGANSDLVANEAEGAGGATEAEPFEVAELSILEVAHSSGAASEHAEDSH